MRTFGGGNRFRGGGGGRFDRGSRRRDFDVNKPIKVGDEIEVDIVEVGSRGDGLAKVQNFVIFVPNTNKGDHVKIKIRDVRSTSAVGEVVSGAAGESETIEEIAEEAGVTDAEKESAGEVEGEIEDKEENKEESKEEGGDTNARDEPEPPGPFPDFPQPSEPEDDDDDDEEE